MKIDYTCTEAHTIMRYFYNTMNETKKKGGGIMNCKITYHIRTDYPKDTGFIRKKYSVIGVWVDPRLHQRMTCGAISYYGADSMREARSIMRQLASENQTILV